MLKYKLSGGGPEGVGAVAGTVGDGAGGVLTLPPHPASINRLRNMNTLAILLRIVQALFYRSLPENMLLDDL